MIQISSEKPELFKGRHFNYILIIQAVRWYITYKLSYRDVCDLMAERGVMVVHTTVLRWVQCFVPAFEKKWKNYARPVGSSWRVDETYIKVKGPNCITENLNETESLHHRENLNQIGSRKGDPKDEANDEREAIGDCSDARKISESRQKAEAPNSR